MPGNRVLVVSQPTTAGVAVHIRGLIRAAVKSGFLVTVVCPAEGDLRVWALEAGVDVVTMPMLRSPGVRDIAHFLRLRRMFRDADLIHLHSSKAGALGRAALITMSAANRPKCIFTPHGWSWLAGGRIGSVYKAVECLLAPIAERTIAVSHGEQGTGTDALGKRLANIVVIENGVDTERYHPGGHRIERSADPYLICVGRLTRAKGQGVAIRALALLEDTSPRLGLVGDGEDLEELHDLAADLNVEDRIDWFGQVDDAAPHLRSADVVLVPSRWDGLSLALLEAMACGAPVVATVVPGSEALKGVGVLVPREDPNAMADAVARLLGSSALRRDFGEAARARACERYELQTTVSRTLSVWQDLLERSTLTRRGGTSRARLP